METLGQNYNKLVEETLNAEDPRLKKEKETEMEQEHSSPKSQDLFQNNKVVNHQKKKKKMKCTMTRIKSPISNIAYIGINKEDYYNKNFIFDVYLLLTKNLNPFSLNRKLADKHEMIYMLWRDCMPVEYYKFICEEKNFIYLNGKNVLQPTALQIIVDFAERDEKNLSLLQNNLAQDKNIFQYVYLNVYPEIYCTTEKRGFDLKSYFYFV